ncbi:MAG: hypothetical protein PHQ96_07070 [Candidatus Omnitrophica bacterium]|nr:hypothetical protein [Candidatus Omnitrophota bacterium]
MEEQKKTADTPVTEVKEEKKSSEVGKMMIKMLIGVVLIGLGLWAVIGWWPDLVTVFKGCIGLFLGLAGLIFIAIAKE